MSLTTLIRAVPRYLTLVAALIAAQSCVEAGNHRQIWEFRLDPIIEEPTPSGPASPHTVNAIKFSPDEQQLAVAVGIHPIEGSYTSHLLILETKAPGPVKQQFELNRGVLPNNDVDADLLWAPDGNTVAVSGAIFSVRGGRACAFDTGEAWLGGYLNSQTLVARLTPTHVDREHPNSHFVLFSSDCESQDTWNVDEAWLIQDVSPVHGLAVVKQANLGHVRLFDPPRGATLLVDFRRERVLRRWPADELLPNQVRFAESGKTLCAAAGSAGRYDVPVQCVDVETGNVIAQAASVKRGWSIVTASESSRVVITQYRSEPDNKPTTSVLDRRIVWDFRTGQQIAIWHPEFQKWRFPIGAFEHWRNNPFAVAISPTGRYIAEGGNGVLRLYEIVP